MKKYQLKQLANYSAMAGAFILLNENADAQIIYHDIEPDTVLSEDDEIYYLDMDMDGEFNFYLYKQSFSAITEYGIATAVTIGIVGYSANDDIAASYGLTSLNSTHTTSFFAPYAFYEGESINNALEFHGGSDMAHLQDSYDAGGGWGNWFPDTEDKYLGVRFKGVDEEIHYGWIRCSVVDDYVLIIKDYAYNATPDAPIIAGATLLVPAVTAWIDVTDIGDNISGEDLSFSFQKSIDDALLLEYRVIAVKESAADDFDLNDAVNVLTGNYLSVIPDGSEIYSGDFSGIYDADGDIISNNIPYRLFIYLVGDIAAGEADALSPASESITIQTITEAATDISITDIADNGNTSDIKLYFNQVASEQVIESYRAYILDIITAFGGFTVADALSVSPDHYLEFVPTGAPIDLTLPSGLTDINGNTITWGVPYFIYVMSIDNGFGTGNIMSAPSNELILNFPNAISNPIQNSFQLFASNGIIYIHSINNISNQTVFNLTDVTGKIIYSQDITKTKTTIDLNPPAGIYSATIYSGENVFAEKMIIQK
jgi:hypothetical protein